VGVPVVIQAGTLIDGRGADPVHDATLTIEGEHIATVGTASRDGDVLDLSRYTVMPGLIDAHVHLGLSSDISSTTRNEISVVERAADLFRVCSETLDEGFTTVRDAGGVDGGIVAAVERGLVRGPRILSCGPILCQCGGHGHLASQFTRSETWNEHIDIPGLGAFSQICDGPDAVRRAARDAFRRGASFLKLCVTGGVTSTTDSPEDTQFSIAEITAAVEEARARRTYVTTHALNLTGIKNAIAAGVTCIEHGRLLDEETAAEMASRGVHLVPTLAVMHTYLERFDAMALPESIRERTVGKEAEMAEAVSVASKAGVLIGSGSDYIGPSQARRGLELTLKARLIGAMDAIVSATSSNARILGIDDRLGSIETGKLADLIAFDGDPLADPELFSDPQRVALVMKGGQVVSDRRTSRDGS
jgi:imidazolonepropionase-like amidohydrolase